MTSKNNGLASSLGRSAWVSCPVLCLPMLLFREALSGSNWVFPGPRRTEKTMSTVKFKNGTTRREGWKGQMTKFS